MTKKRKKSIKTRTITKNIKPKDYDELKKKATSEFSNENLRKEITELESKKSSLPKGFKGKLIGMGINKEISRRKAMLRADRRSEQVSRLTTQLSKQVELEKTKNQLLELRKRNQVSFEGLGGGSMMNTPKKQVKFEDLF